MWYTETDRGKGQEAVALVIKRSHLKVHLGAFLELSIVLKCAQNRNVLLATVSPGQCQFRGLSVFCFGMLNPRVECLCHVYMTFDSSACFLITQNKLLFFHFCNELSQCVDLSRLFLPVGGDSKKEEVGGCSKRPGQQLNSVLPVMVISCVKTGMYILNHAIVFIRDVTQHKS